MFLNFLCAFLHSNNRFVYLFIFSVKWLSYLTVHFCKNLASLKSHSTYSNLKTSISLQLPTLKLLKMLLKKDQQNTDMQYNNVCVTRYIIQQWFTVVLAFNSCYRELCVSFPALIDTRWPPLMHPSLKELHSVQFSRSVVSDSCDPMNHSTPGLPVHHQLLEFTQTQVHRVSDAIQPSPPLSSPSPPAPNPAQHQSLFQWVNSSHQVAKVLEFQLRHHSFQRNPRADLLQNGLVGSPCSPRDSQESSPTPQFKSINSSNCIITK